MKYHRQTNQPKNPAAANQQPKPQNPQHSQKPRVNPNILPTFQNRTKTDTAPLHFCIYLKVYMQEMQNRSRLVALCTLCICNSDATYAKNLRVNPNPKT